MKMKSFIKSKRLLSAILAIALLATTFVFAPVAADSAVKDSAVAKINFWVGSTQNTAVKELGTVRAHYTGSSESGTAYLFLPSDMDTSALKVFFYDDIESVILRYPTESGALGSVTLHSGDTTDAFAYGCNREENFYLTLDSKEYTIKVYQSANIGTIYFTTTSGNTDNIDDDKDSYEAGTIRVIDENGKLDYNGVMEKISRRGNATWGYTKQPYNIKLASSTSLLGMAKAKKWVLLANHVDDTLVKDQLTYDFAKYIGIEYQVICKPVDLYANGKYMGNYFLAEKVEIKSDRVDISDSYEALELANGTTTENGTLNPADLAAMDAAGTINTRVIDKDNSTIQFANDYTIESANSFAHSVGTRKYTIKGSASDNLEDPVDLTGGYIFELEISNRWPQEIGLCGYNRQGWAIKSHAYASRHQIDYCYNILYAIGSAVYNGGTVPNKSTTTTCLRLQGS
jgi:hypothetical protein